MKNILKVIENYQQKDTEQKTIGFSEKGFAKLCDAFKSGMVSSVITGFAVGGLTVCMVTMGFKGYDMLKEYRERKYLAVLNGVDPFKSRSKEIVVFVKAKDDKEAEKKVEDIIKNEFDNEFALEKIHEI